MCVSGLHLRGQIVEGIHPPRLILPLLEIYMYTYVGQSIATNAIQKNKARGNEAEMAKIVRGKAECYISIEAKCFIFRIA